MSGNNYLINFHPTKPEVVFLGPNMGNSYRSVDGGDTYTDILDYDGPDGIENRGPVRIAYTDFCISAPDFGLATQEREPSLWKTNDTGATWSKAKMPNVGNSLISSIAIHPNDKDTWVVGTGATNHVNAFTIDKDNPRGAVLNNAFPQVAGVWKTVDAGASWVAVSLPGIASDAHIVKLVFDRSSPQYVYAATTDGFYRSANFGDSFEKFGDLNGATATDNEAVRSLDIFYPQNGSTPTLFAVKQVAYRLASNSMVEVESGGVYKSADRGQTWEAIHGSPTGTQSLYLNLDEPGLYWLKTTFRSDLAAGWFNTPVASADTDYSVLPTAIMPSFTKVVVNPQNVNDVYVVNDYKAKGGHTMRAGTLWRTRDGGNTWFVTLRNGTHWEDKDASFWNARQPGQTAHNITWRSMRHWKEKGAYFEKAGSALGFTADGSRLFFQIAKVMFLSTDGGDTWTEWDDLPFGDPADQKWISAGNSNLPGRDFVQDPRQPELLYFGSGENDFWVADTRDVQPSGAQPVKRVKLSSAADTDEYSVSVIAKDPNPAFPNRVYTLQFRQNQAGKLLRSDDPLAGAPFQEVSTIFPAWAGSDGDNPVQQNSLIIHPTNYQTMYFAVPYTASSLNYVGDSVDHVGLYRSTDGGVNWAKIDAQNGLPANSQSGEFDKGGARVSTNVSKVVLHPNNPDVVFVAVYDQRVRNQEGGLFMSTDGGDQWTLVDLPGNVRSAVDIVFDDAGRMYVSVGSKNLGANKGGVFWAPVFDAPGTINWTSVFDMPFTGQIAVHDTDENVMLVTVMPANAFAHGNPGVYLSTDRGLSWNKINTGIGRSDLINDVAIDVLNKNVFYLSTWGSGHFRGELK